MAILDEGILIRGNTDGYNFYIMSKHRKKRTYVRRKSSLTRKRVLSDATFEKTRQYATKMGIASKIASAIYRALPLDIDGHWLYRAIAGEAASLLYGGKTEEQVNEFLWNKYIHEPGCTSKEPVKKGMFNFSFTTKENRKQLRELFRIRWQAQGKSAYTFKRVWERRGLFKQEKVDIPRRFDLIQLI